MAEKWVTVVNYSLPGTAPKRVPERHYKLNLSEKGFEIYDPKTDQEKLHRGRVMKTKDLSSKGKEGIGVGEPDADDDKKAGS